METVNSENSLSKDTDSEDNDLLLKLKKLSDRVALHETEKQKMREEFGLQRAKMKELFLQKEEELKKESSEHDNLKEIIKKLEADLNDARTQLTVVGIQYDNQLEDERRKYRDEVASLQQLITETVDESSRNEEEVKQLRRLNEKLEAELDELRHCGGGIGDTNVSGGGGGAQLLTAPTAMISTLARRVVSQLGADSSTSTSLTQNQASNVTGSDNLEESMRKVNKYAQEDAEVLRSLVIPLEEEIKALKDKLRKNDEKLRKLELISDSDNEKSSTVAITSAGASGDDSSNIYVLGGSCESDSDKSILAVNSPGEILPEKLLSPSDVASSQPALSSSLVSSHQDALATSLQPASCDCDLNAVASDFSSAGTKSGCEFHHDDGTRQVVSVVHNAKKSCDMCENYEAQLVSIQEKCRELEKQILVLERCREELAKEQLIRKDMEQKWNEKKEMHKAEVTELQTTVKDVTSALKEIKELHTNTKAQVTDELNRLTNERREIQLQLDRLQTENENLIGKRNACARELQDEVINLPDKVEDLQEMLLKCREDLISARVGQEAAEREVTNLKEEAQLQRYQIQADNQTRQQLKNTLTAETESLKVQLHKSEMARHQNQLIMQRLSNEEKNLRLEIEDLNMQLVTTSNSKKLLEEQVSNLKSSLSSLQAELHNSEIVQKDFVRLSQSLQQELERIRSSRTQVRWEHEDDIDQCPGCRQSFNVTRRKQHCRHCGRIFCVPCLAHTVLSGPNQRPSKVCDVCHTLLVEDTAPYFSTEPPHSSN